MHWSFEDPARFEGTKEEKLVKFREVRDLIEAKVKAWVAEQSPVLS
jgi:arsenate reductase